MIVIPEMTKEEKKEELENYVRRLRVQTHSYLHEGREILRNTSFLHYQVLDGAHDNAVLKRVITVVNDGLFEAIAQQIDVPEAKERFLQLKVDVRQKFKDTLYEAWQPYQNDAWFHPESLKIVLQLTFFKDWVSFALTIFPVFAEHIEEILNPK